ncbi:MAG TPA: hypothetical protein VLI90_13185 [Tepidisphaeraceae bacterium]|nr:hypothetical protein [Tepidisphaeraceae bacterium]
MTKADQRNELLCSRARRAGCEIYSGEAGKKTVLVLMPGFPEYGTGVDMTAKIDAFLATGSPHVSQIIDAAVCQAEAENYYPAWNYVCDTYTPKEVARRESKALRRKIIARGWLVRSKDRHD